MKTRVLTALLIVACVIPPLVLGGKLLFLLVAFIVIAGAIELLGLGEKRSSWPKAVLPLAVLCVFALLFVKEALLLPALGACMLLFLSVPVFCRSFPAKDAFLCIGYLCLFSIIARAFLFIYRSDSFYIWYIILATYACDTGAYFCGRFLGKHKLNERVSPKKTWEGSIGGWIFGTLLSFAFGYVFLKELGVGALLLSSMLLSVVGQLGDLAFSAIKRSCRIKDFSDLLPGHGGVLDRIDSLVFNFICFHLILVVLTL